MTGMAEERLVNLLLRGAQPLQEDEKPAEDDDYTDEFNKNNLTAVAVPVLKFRFKNLDLLAQMLSELDEDSSKPLNGLIVTSPRVVEALRRAALSKSEKLDEIFSRIPSDHLFVVGQRTGMLCKQMLKTNFNLSSSESGKGQVLGENIKAFFRSSGGKKVNLIYPKGSRSSNDIENTLADEPHIIIKPIVVYDTEQIDDLNNLILNRLDSLASSDEVRRVSLNMIFFSPSGVEGYLKIDQNCLQERVKEILKASELNLRYTSIGTTTKDALLRNNMKVFCVSERPTPAGLVESIIRAIRSAESSDLKE